MELNTIWFILIAVLYIGFFLLEGFDFGVGILLPFLSRDQDSQRVDLKRRVMINTIGPHWDGNEVWLLTAGGATFAAFPNWYATMFSGFYLALFLLLISLIFRGVAFEFRSKDTNPRWRHLWDWSIFIGSLLPPLLIGVAFANLVRGVPINAQMEYTGGFFNLLNPYALLAGVTSVVLCTLYGAIFLSLKTTGELVEKARKTSWRMWITAVIVMLLLLLGTYLQTDILTHLGVNPGLVPVIGILAIASAGYFIRKKMDGWSFIMVAVSFIFTLMTMFYILYPRVMVSSSNPDWSLTIENAASSPYTLKVMTIVAVIFIPVVLIYQGWTYWVFRKRITNQPQQLTY
jgi:cytochrome d ubiquinol oxidase subunit II